MSVTTVTKTWAEWRLWGQGYSWSTRYTASCVITVTRNTGSDTATVKFDATMTTPSGDNALGDWQCIPTINGASSGGGEKNFVVASAGYHGANSSYTVSQTYTVGVGVSAGTLTGTIKFRIGGYPDYQGEYSEAQSWSLNYDTKGTPSQATWSNYYWGQASTITIQRTVPDFRESVYLVWQDDTSHPVTIRTYSQSSATSISYTIPYASCPTNAKTRSAKIRVVTYNGSTQIGTWETSAVTVSLLSGDTAYNPTLSANPVCEAYNDVVASLGTDTAVAQYSKLNVKANKSDVSCKYSATIASRVVTFSNGSSASADQTNHISSVIQSAGTVNWTYKVTDSRGYTAERNGSYNVINSSAPSIPPENVTVYRGDSSGNAEDGGAYIYATATATCESLNGHNSVTLQGKVGSGSYQNMTNGTRKTLMSNADPNTQYVVTLKATDLLRFTTMDFILPSADCPFHIPSGKHGVGIGMKAQASDNKLYVGYDTELYGGLIKHDSVLNKDIDIIQTHDSLLGGWGTEITANKNLNSEEFCNVGRYFCPSSATPPTLTNCPTRTAFSMVVRNGNHEHTTISTNWSYFIRELTDLSGDTWVQLVRNENGITYGLWDKVVINGRYIASGGNLNDYDVSKAGLFEVRNGVSNSPLSWGALLVGGTSGSHQLLWNNGGMFFRSKTGSPLAWTGWRQVTSLNASATVTTKSFTVPTANVWQKVHSVSVANGIHYVRARVSYSYTKPLAIALVDENRRIQYSRDDNVSQDYGGILIGGNQMSWLETDALIRTDDGIIAVYAVYAAATTNSNVLNFELQTLA